jgi:RimJ/RimL family protein N-acetyltransferase
VAELNGKPAGEISLWLRSGAGKDRHVAWLGIAVRRKFWGKGVGAGLMNEAKNLAGKSGCRRLMLGTIEGNEKAIGLYGKFGFKTEAYERARYSLMRQKQACPSRTHLAVGASRKME